MTDRLSDLTLRATDLARLLGISDRRVRELRDQGVIPDNGKGQYRALDAVPAYCAHMRPSQGRAAAGGVDEDLDLTAERARKAKEEADRLEMLNAQMRGRLLNREDVDAAVAAAFARVRARLISIPAKVAPVITTMETPAEAQAALRDAIYEALRELSETTVTDLGGDDGDVVEASSAAAGLDGEPMGGREEEA